MDESFQLNIKKFNIRKMDRNSKVVVLGKPGTGKTSIITDLLYTHRNIPMGMIMSGTEESNHHYKDMIPDTFIYSEYDKPAIEKLIKRQKTAIRKNIKNKEAFLVMDDCMDDKKWLKEKSTRGIFKNGRHWALFFIMASQYCMDLPPELRSCIDYVFIMKENIPNNRKKIFDNYCGIFPTFQMFEEVFNACTSDFQCVVVKNRCNSNRIEDMIFWYKADLHDPFKIGGPSFWQYHKANYNPKHYEEYDDFESNEIDRTRHKKKVKNLVIRKHN